LAEKDRALKHHYGLRGVRRLATVEERCIAAAAAAEQLLLQQLLAAYF